MKKILHLKRPKTDKEVRQRLGTINYYGKFIPKLKEIAEPLYNMLKKGKKFSWGAPEAEAFKKIKETLSDCTKLAPFNTDNTKKVRLTCDASEKGIGAVLEQQQSNDNIKQFYIGRHY